jgi:hypothetical protein
MMIFRTPAADLVFTSRYTQNSAAIPVCRAEMD